MKYFVTMGERQIEVVIDGDEVIVDGERMRASIRQVVGAPLVHLLIDDRSWTFPIASGGQKGVWEVQDGGAVLEIEVQDARTKHIRSLLGGGQAARRGGGLKAPMPGLVLRVLVETGDHVVSGQGLIVLEAMKMENELKAPQDGVVSQVAVIAGQAVEKGAILVELNPPENT